MLKSQPMRPLTHAVLLGLLLVPALAGAQASQNFQLAVNNAVSFTPFHPNGISDNTPPFVMCRGYQLGIRLRYTWRNTYAEQVSTEPFGTFYPQFFPQGLAPNPLHLPAAQAGQPLIRLVDTGLIPGPVNTAGIKTVQYRGRTIYNYDPITGLPRTPQTVTVNVVIDNQFEPSSTRYQELANNVRDMPTRPWLSWYDDLAATDYRVDVDRCRVNEPGSMCSDMEFMPLDQNPNNPNCAHSGGVSDYCTITSANSVQVQTTLATDTFHEYRILGRNTCGVSEEQNATPVGRPSFKTAQACFAGGFVPDGGVLNLDVGTAIRDSGIPNALTPNLRVTVHALHSRVSDLKISLTKTAPVVFGPVILMDRPAAFPGAGNCDGPRIQAAFGDQGSFVNGACQATEPTLRGSIGPLQSLATFAPAQGAGNWRLTVEDAVPNGTAGSVLEWCLSADIPLQSAPFVPVPLEMIFEDGLEDEQL